MFFSEFTDCLKCTPPPADISYTNMTDLKLSEDLFNSFGRLIVPKVFVMQGLRELGEHYTVENRTTDTFRGLNKKKFYLTLLRFLTVSTNLKHLIQLLCFLFHLITHCLLFKRWK